MAAAATDLLMEVGIASATTLDSNYTVSDTSVTVASTSGWPTATGVAFAMDVIDGDGVQVPGSYNEYVGVVSSGTSITSVSHQNGTDRNYSAGATTRVYIPVSAERENRIVEWGLTHAEQDGTLKANTVDTTQLVDDAVTTAKIEDEAVTTAKIDDGAVTPNKVKTGASTLDTWAWDTWTPTLSGRFNDSKWTKAGKYIRIGDTVIAQITLTANAGTPMDGGVAEAIYTLPVTSIDYGTTEVPILGQVSFVDTGTALFAGVSQWVSTTTAHVRANLASGTYTQPASTTSAVPFTWVSGDKLFINIIYQAA